MKISVGRIAAGLVAAVGIAALLPWTFPDAFFRGPIVAQLEAELGLQTGSIGRATIAFLPRPRLTFENVAVHDSAGALAIEAPAIRGDLRLVSLLHGQIELKSVQLETPTVFIDLDKGPFVQRGAIARALKARAGSPEAAAADSAALASVSVNSGLLRLASKARGFETLIQDVYANLDWREVGAPAVLAGKAVWRGEPTEFQLMVARPAALLRGDQSDVTLKIRGRAMELEADGRMSGIPRAQFQGTIKAATPSLRQFGRMFSLSVPLPGPLGPASVEGDASITGENVWLTDARIGLDGNTFEGSLAMGASNGNATLSGTLATDQLQLDEIVSDLPPLRSSDGQWSKEPFDLSGVTRSDLDLRISAAHVRLGNLEAEDAALSILVKGGRMEASLAEAQAYKGTVKLRAVETTEPPNIDLKVNGSFAQIDINSFLQAAADSAWLSGSASGQFGLESIGSTPAAVMGALDGHGEITIDQGEIEGINIEQALRRVEKRPLLSASDVHYGRTIFDRAHATVDVSQGIAQIGNGVVGGPAARVSFVGTASLADRTLLLRARASQTGPDGAPRPGGPELSFTASGTWDDIDVEPDAESLIRHSDAAAPLLGIHRDGVSLSPPIKGAPGGAITPTLQ